MLRMDKSYNPNYGTDDLFLKMEGRKLYEYALKTVPQLIKDTIDMAGIGIDDVSRVLIHQANAKMDDAQGSTPENGELTLSNPLLTGCSFENITSFIKKSLSI